MCICFRFSRGRNRRSQTYVSGIMGPSKGLRYTRPDTQRNKQPNENHLMASIALASALAARSLLSLWDMRLRQVIDDR